MDQVIARKLLRRDKILFLKKHFSASNCTRLLFTVFTVMLTPIRMMMMMMVIIKIIIIILIFLHYCYILIMAANLFPKLLIASIVSLMQW